MREINIFLASSVVDFETERKEISNFVINEIGERLRAEKDIRLDIKKCEDVDNKVVPEGLQKIYDAELVKSDLALFLFNKKAGEFTLGELDLAAQKLTKDKIVVICLEDPYKSDNDTLKQLAEKLEKYQIDRKKVSNITEIKLEILKRLIFVI